MLPHTQHELRSKLGTLISFVASGRVNESAYSAQSLDFGLFSGFIVLRHIPNWTDQFSGNPS